MTNKVSEEKYIELKNIHFESQASMILENINLDIFAGEYLGILGPNGSGKTTLLKIILGLIEPTSGTVHIFGEQFEDYIQHDQIGYVPQRISQVHSKFPATVQEVIRTGRTSSAGMFKKLNQKDTKAIQNAMEVSGVTHLQKRLIGELSGGERQRVFIARALASNPCILILDEPMAGVDLKSQNKFYKFLKHLNQDLHITIILVSHDIDTIINEVNLVVCLNQTLVCHMPMKEFKKDKYLRNLYGHKFKHVHHDHE